MELPLAGLPAPPPAPVRAAPAPLSEPASGTGPRADALDVLRGLAILMMVLSGIVPFGPATPLPGWMYHAQVPPPAHVFDAARPGITWVDLVFPFFLFALGAALPLALGRRLARGESAGRVAAEGLGRGGLLLFFALFVQHVRPWTLAGGAAVYTSTALRPWGLALVGFALLWALLWRTPRHWPRTWTRTLRAGGWLGALAFLALVRYPDGSGFKPDRYDIILVVLANMAAVGGLLWLATRHRPRVRDTVLVLLAAAILAGREPGWVQPLMEWKPLWGWFRPYYLKYLFLVVPGMAVGEGFAAWLSAPPHAAPRWSRAHALGVALGALGVVAGVTAGLYVRAVGPTVLGASLLLAAGIAATRRPGDASERLVARLVAAGAAWLLLGLVLEPFEGGIKKDPSTFSDYFVTGGLAHAALAAFVLLGTRFGVRLRLLAANGQNPMLAYVTLHNLLLPVLAVTGVFVWLQRVSPGAWPGFGRAVLLTGLTALVVALCTRRGWFWRT